MFSPHQIYPSQILSFCTAQGPTLTLEPTEQTVFEYDNAIVRCTPISSADDFILHEKVPGGTFTPINLNDARLSTETDGDTEVFLYNVTREDNGIILRCVLGGFTSTNVSTVTVQCTLSVDFRFVNCMTCGARSFEALEHFHRVTEPISSYL